MSKVSIVVLNWNGRKFLKKCLDSLQKLTYPQIEIIVVDNNSTDGSQQFIKKNYPKVILIANKKNYGFAQGNNIGFQKSSGEYVMFLNNDTVVTSTFLEPLITDLKKDSKIGCIQPQMRVMKNKDLIDEVGSFITFTGFLYHYGYRKNYKLEKYNKVKEIFSAKGACMLFPRKVLEKVGLLDEDFFIFFEETDLCFRIWLAGYKVIYEPSSVIYHVVGGDTTSSDKYNYERRIYLIFKNTTCSYLKNFGTLNLLTIFPVFIFVQISVMLSFILKRRFNLVREIFKAYWWNILNLARTLKKRQIIQHKIRKVSDNKLNSYIKLNPNLSYYYYSLFKTTQEYND